MAARDFYDVLGVARTASADDIKKAYRERARRLHPDVNKAADAQAKFTEVQEAYDVLSDGEKRTLYDRVGRSGFEAAREAGASGTYSWSNVGGAGGPGGAAGFEDLEELFGAFFGGRGPSARSGPASGRRPRPAASAGRDVEHEITVPFDVAALGGSHQVRLDRGGVARTIDVTIPKATHAGGRLRVRGEGAAGRGGGRSGDLLLRVRIGAHPTLRRDGLDLHTSVQLGIDEATLGSTREITVLGRTVDIRTPPGAPSGRKLRLRGMGIENTEGRQGDLLVEIQIVPPDGSAFSEEDRVTLRRLAGGDQAD
ncbi:MAG: DnaJ C-terminal domain-containing protein [Planctomycetota bacterium]